MVASVSGLGVEPSLRRIVVEVRVHQIVAGGWERKYVEAGLGRMFAGQEQESRFAVARRTGRRQTRSPAVAAVAPGSHVEREKHEGRLLPRRRRRPLEVLAALAERRPCHTGRRPVGQARCPACRIRYMRRVHRIEASALEMCYIRIPLAMVLASVRNPGRLSHPSFAPCGMKPATDRSHCASGCRPARVVHMHLHPGQHPYSRWLRPGVPVVRTDFWRFAR